MGIRLLWFVCSLQPYKEKHGTCCSSDRGACRIWGKMRKLWTPLVARLAVVELGDAQELLVKYPDNVVLRDAALLVDGN